jgi:hypothetical protein
MVKRPSGNSGTTPIPAGVATGRHGAQPTKFRELHRRCRTVHVTASTCISPLQLLPLARSRRPFPDCQAASSALLIFCIGHARPGAVWRAVYPTANLTVAGTEATWPLIPSNVMESVPEKPVRGT